jgi:hypothetical protein
MILFVILFTRGDTVISKENERTLITIPKKLKLYLKKLAEKENRSFNNLVINILKIYVDNLHQKKSKDTQSNDIEK